MLDPRLTKLADILVNYSTKVQKGDNVLIDSTGIDTSLAKELVKAVHKNVPSPYQGFTFENVRLEFKDGEIIHAAANNTERLNNILDADEGARYIGEFAIGVNPAIREPMQDILFDEKIDGSFHFTPGRCYDNASNGNESAIHWDMVMIQRSEYGGGEIWFDDRLIRKDGRFVIPELEKLNPENLK
ncbi:aminopeptidase [Paenibacillus sp. NAIST15-1]|nr:aminopeptidase [Paenibacillus sp. NAIST15-1]